MRIGLLFCFALLLFSASLEPHCLGATSDDFKSDTDTGLTVESAKAFKRIHGRAKKLLKEGKLGQAAKEYKKAADTPHNPGFSLWLDLHHLVSEAPFDPNAHIAYGIDSMNRLDVRYNRGANEILAGAEEAEWEFKTAISLSPGEKCAEAEKLLLGRRLSSTRTT